MSAASERLLSSRFFVMCGFTFTVFLSVFQLLPTAPFHIIELGGSTFAAGMFLGFLTYSSAFSAPFTGRFVDRAGQRRVLIITSVAIALFSGAYGVIRSYQVLLALVVVHGIFWSGLLSASAAYVTGMLPPRRRAEGIGYWGLSSVAAIAIAPSVGFWIYRRGWIWLCAESVALNLMMTAIAWNLPEEVDSDARARGTRLLEWRVLFLSLTLFLYTFGYGGITSFTAMYASANGVTPKGLYLTLLAVVVLGSRLVAGRLGDRLGYKRAFVPCLLLITAGLACLAAGGTRTWLVISATLFGAGFGTAYPVFVAYIMEDVPEGNRGGAFGAILAAFDTGIGTGSIAVGWLIQHFSFAAAFATAAAISALALPYFLIVERRLRAPVTMSASH